MLGEAALSETALAESVDTGVPIIPEVTVEGKELVFVVEITLLHPGDT